jgi:hypothetical protein
MNADNSWSDAQRLEGYAGEVRVNLIRLAAIVVFYGHHLVNVLLIHQDEPSLQGSYHALVTALALAWAMAVLAIHFCLSRRWVPPALKYVATAWDLLLVTALLIIGRDPKNMLAVLYFLVIFAGALRLSLPLVYAATLGAMTAYVFFLGYLRFGLHLSDAERLSRPQQIIFLLALGTAGLLAGQVVRQVHRLLQGYPVRVVDAQEKA